MSVVAILQQATGQTIIFSCESLFRIVRMHSKMPPRKPDKYEALCAHQSAMNSACLTGGRLEPTQPGGLIAPRLVSTYPVSPAIAARSPIAKSNFDMGPTSSLTSILLREPALAESARRTPRIAPTHHVAITPQPNASSAGDAVENTGG